MQNISSFSIDTTALGYRLHVVAKRERMEGVKQAA